MRNVLFTAIIAVASIAGCKAKHSEPRDHNAITAGDIDVTQKIRHAVADDNTLSPTAHNCAVAVNDGVITLDGPVESVVERERVEQIAMSIVGLNQRVLNKLEVVTHN